MSVPRVRMFALAYLLLIAPAHAQTWIEYAPEGIGFRVECRDRGR